MQVIKLISVLMVIAAVILFGGCSTLSPTGPDSESQTDQTAPVILPTATGNETDDSVAPPPTDEGPAETWYGQHTYFFGSSNQVALIIGDVAQFVTRGQDIVSTSLNSNSCTITIEAEKWETHPDFPDGVIFFKCSPSGTAFSPAATLELFWNRLNLPSTAELKLYHAEESDGAWTRVSVSTEDADPVFMWDNVNKSVTVSIPHFSIWAISGD